jgi:hypothetical protein
MSPGPILRRLLPLPLLAPALIVGGCERLTEARAAAVEVELPPVHVDSILPIEEEVRRFRDAFPVPVERLAGGASSRDKLVERFLDALEAGDRARVAALAITPEEFIYLYYPGSRHSRRPYEMSPALLWFQVDGFGSRGLDRALQRFGGRPLATTGYECPSDPEVEGGNRVWSGCEIQSEAGEGGRLSLFGPILERDGHFKFVSLGNRL